MSKACMRTLASLALLGVFACALTLAGAPARAARGHAFGGSFGSPGSGEGELSEPSGIAVDEATGDVYVVDEGNDRVEYFNGSTGAYLGQFNGSGTLPGEGAASPTGRFSNPLGIAVDNNSASPSHGDVYVVDAGHFALDKFTATGSYVGQITGTPEESFGNIYGVSTSAGGELWIEDRHVGRETASSASACAMRYEPCRFDRFSNAVSNSYIESIVPTPVTAYAIVPGPFAIDSKGNFYADTVFANETPLTKFDGQAQEVESVVGGEYGHQAWDKEFETPRVAVESTSDDVYVGNVSYLARLTPAGALIESLSQSGMHLAGVAVDAASGRVYATDSAAGLVDVFPSEPPSRPRVENESASDVAGTSATVQAEVNPRSVAGEEVTDYRFEYGACATLESCASSGFEASVPVPGGELPADYEIHGLSVHIGGLRPGTPYRFRIVASNSHGVSEGESVEGSEVVRTFTTQTTGAFALLDNRQWEMVSPPQKRGALVEPIGQEGLIQAAADGESFTFHTNQPTEANPAGYANQVQLLAARGPEGWSSTDIAIPHDPATGKSEGVGEDYRFFSEDLSSAVVQPAGAFIPASSSQAIAPTEASEQTAFLRKDFNATGGICSTSCYRPLVSGLAGHANVPEGTKFGEEGTCPYLEASCGPMFAGASPNGQHVVLSSNVALTGTAVPPGRQQLYEWSAGRLSLVSVLPDGSPSGEGAVLKTSFLNNARSAVSEDGTRVIWQTTGGSVNLYATDTQTGHSVQLDAVQGGSGEGSSTPVLQASAPDGSRVLFTDSQRLTAESGAGEDLYECVIVETAGQPRCELSDLTPANGTERAKVLGAALGASEDGSTVYFAANGLLSNGGVPVAGAVKGDCETSISPGRLCNLYVRREGKTSLVAVISGDDTPDFGVGGLLSEITARVSPNGDWLAFMSDRELAGYNTHDFASGKLDEELYLYHAGGHGEAGTLTCASCDPTGGRPAGVEYGQEGQGVPLLTSSRGWERHTWLAADVPGWTTYRLSETVYQSRYLSDSGRLFFNSPDALVPQDVNGTWDVYEYEPVGVGDCVSGGTRYSPRSNGCVDLISSGGSAEESAFMDASETGGDVFFLTKAKLAPQDYDEAFDVYDAHECTAASPCQPQAVPLPPACTTAEACRAAPAPEPGVFGAPPSATFNGLGNFAPAVPVTKAVKAKAKTPTRAQQLKLALARCRKLKAKRRAACQRSARSHYARVKSAHRSKARRGGGA
jgi:DNA-binding beta-propeller fold protein YncE